MDLGPRFELPPLAPIGRGAEGVVYRIGARAVKFRHLSDVPERMLAYCFDQAQQLNGCFGVGAAVHGHWRRGPLAGIVTSQPFITGPHPSPREISRYLRARGFNAGAGEWTRDSLRIPASEVRARNFIRGRGGVVPIDLRLLPR